MESGERYEVVIPCDFYNSDNGEAMAEIIFCFGPQFWGHKFNCGTRIKSGNWEMVIPETMYGGHEVAAFIDQLQSLYDNLQGKVVFHDWNLQSKITFEVCSRARGMIAVSGEFRFFGFEDDFSVTFNHFSFDQTYLPGIIKDFKAALKATGVSLEPM